MNNAPTSFAHVFKVGFARLQQWLGLPGQIGLGMLLAAGVVLSFAYRQHALAVFPADTIKPERQSQEALQPGRRADSALRLPPASDIPLLLTRIQRAAIEEGLGWPKADYRFTEATEEAPAAVEVRCALKGQYPSIRRFVTALLLDAPTLTLRDFALSRPSPDSPDVEAKLGIVVYVASGSSAVPRKSP